MTDDTDDATNPAKLAYDAAKQFAQEGRFAEALERHEWFHRHALEHHPAYYGVRLSFALAAWKELGEKYPPALESLCRVRDEGVASLRAGDASDSLFHDVVSINHTLEEDESTVALFRELEASDPEAAMRRFRCMKEVALAKAPDLFLHYTNDLLSYLQDQRRLHLDSKASRRRLPQMDPRMTEALHRVDKMFDDRFDALCEQLIELAMTSGRIEQATAMKQLVRQWKLHEASDSDD